MELLKSATKAIRKIETSGHVDIGTRWGIGRHISLLKKYLIRNIKPSANNMEKSETTTQGARKC